jgi:hypothetical protein
VSSSTSSSKAFLGAFGLAFAIVFGVSIGATEMLLRRHVLPFDTHADYKKRFLSSTADTAAFGDSHVANGLASGPGFDNFGQASDNLQTVIFKVGHRLQRGGLKRVILQADPQVFAPYRLKEEQVSRIAALTNPDDPPLAILRAEYRQYLMGYWWAALRDPRMIFREPSRTDQTTARFNARPKAEQASEASLRVQLHTPAANLASTTAAINFHKLLQQLRQAGAQVCLVAFPISSAYREAAAGSSAFANSASFFLESANNYGARYADLSRVFPDDRFSDPDHLQHESANEFRDKAIEACFGQEKGKS